MGPLRLIDEIGVDITVDIANTLEKAYGKRNRAPKILREMQSAKMLGRKAGGGFYKYEGKSQTQNAEIEKWRAAPSGHPERSEGPHDSGPREVSRFARNDRESMANQLMFLM